jgi:hypothetical protein
VTLGTTCREYNHGSFAVFQLPLLKPVLDFKGYGRTVQLSGSMNLGKTPGSGLHTSEIPPLFLLTVFAATML